MGRVGKNWLCPFRFIKLWALTPKLFKLLLVLQLVLFISPKFTQESLCSLFSLKKLSLWRIFVFGGNSGGCEVSKESGTIAGWVFTAVTGWPLEIEGWPLDRRLAFRQFSGVLNSELLEFWLSRLPETKYILILIFFFTYYIIFFHSHSNMD